MRRRNRQRIAREAAEAINDIHDCSIPGRYASMPGGPIPMPRL
jgi:hypothetical protein